MGVAISNGPFFSNSILTSITIPNSVTSIGAGAFGFCTSLRSVTIPDGVTNLGGWAFEYCHSLTNVTIGSGITCIECALFSFCPNLMSVTIGERVVSIAGSAFDGCSRLTSLTLPGSVASIEDEVFRRCSNLRGVYFRGDAPTIGRSLFYQSGLAVIYFLPGTANWTSDFGRLPTAPWLLPYPLILATTSSFHTPSNGFGFRISWATNASVVVEACTDLATPGWSPVSTNTLSDGWTDFTDPSYATYPQRFYRVKGR